MRTLLTIGTLLLLGAMSATPVSAHWSCEDLAGFGTTCTNGHVDEGVFGTKLDVHVEAAGVTADVEACVVVNLECPE